MQSPEEVTIPFQISSEYDLVAVKKFFKEGESSIRIFPQYSAIRKIRSTGCFIEANMFKLNRRVQKLYRYDTRDKIYKPKEYVYGLASQIKFQRWDILKTFDNETYTFFKYEEIDIKKKEKKAHELFVKIKFNPDEPISYVAYSAAEKVDKKVQEFHKNITIPVTPVSLLSTACNSAIYNGFTNLISGTALRFEETGSTFIYTASLDKSEDMKDEIIYGNCAPTSAYQYTVRILTSNPEEYKDKNGQPCKPKREFIDIAGERKYLYSVYMVYKLDYEIGRMTDAQLAQYAILLHNPAYTRYRLKKGFVISNDLRQGDIDDDWERDFGLVATNLTKVCMVLKKYFRIFDTLEILKLVAINVGGHTGKELINKMTTHGDINNSNAKHDILSIISYYNELMDYINSETHGEVTVHDLPYVEHFYKYANGVSVDQYYIALKISQYLYDYAGMDKYSLCRIGMSNLASVLSDRYMNACMKKNNADINLLSLLLSNCVYSTWIDPIHLNNHLVIKYNSVYRFIRERLDVKLQVKKNPAVKKQTAKIIKADGEYLYVNDEYLVDDIILYNFKDLGSDEIFNCYTSYTPDEYAVKMYYYKDIGKKKVDKIFQKIIENEVIVYFPDGSKFSYIDYRNARYIAPGAARILDPETEFYYNEDNKLMYHMSTDENGHTIEDPIIVNVDGKQIHVRYSTSPDSPHWFQCMTWLYYNRDNI